MDVLVPLVRQDLWARYVRGESKGYVTRLKEDIRLNGIREPIKLRIYENKGLGVVDGFHRLFCAYLLGLERIPCVFDGFDDFVFSIE